MKRAPLRATNNLAVTELEIKVSNGSRLKIIQKPSLTPANNSRNFNTGWPESLGFSGSNLLVKFFFFNS